MSAKKENKKNKKPGAAPKGKRIALWAVIVVLAVILAGLLLIWWALAYTEGLENTEPSATIAQTDALGPMAGGMKDISVDLGHGMQLINIGSYTGDYVEDGTNEIVSGVLMVIVTNTGEEAIEYASITVPTAEGNANFSVSTLLPGTSVVLLEKTRMAYTGQEDVAQASADAVAVFQKPLSLHEDKLQMQILDGVINVINISGQDITGDIVIYYKNAAADLYYGGITYRVRIKGGIGADEIKQITEDHFSSSGSKIMFVTIG